VKFKPYEWRHKSKTDTDRKSRSKPIASYLLLFGIQGVKVNSYIES